MDRREALRAASVLAAGAVASACDASSPASPRTGPDTAAAPPPPRPPPPPAPPPPGPAPAATPAPPRSAAATSPAAGVPATEISHGPRNRAMVALTFHGQGDPVLVSRILDEIAKGRAK